MEVWAAMVQNFSLRQNADKIPCIKCVEINVYAGLIETRVQGKK